MERHLSPSALSRFFSGQTAEAEAGLDAAHLAHCRECREQAASVVEEMRQTGRWRPAPAGEPRSAVAALLDHERNAALRRLLARAWWAERRSLPLSELVRRFERQSDHRTIEMFEVILADAAAVALEEPGTAETMALAAHALARRFPESHLSSHDHQGKAMTVVANCRRLTGDWRGAAAALAEARASLAQGTGEPALEARRLSIEASLASDLGDLERAKEHLHRAAGLFREARLATAVASIAVQEAGSFLAAGLHAEAIERAEEALRWLTPKESRLQMLAQSLITECLAALGQPTDALRTFIATLPLCEQMGGRRMELKVRYLGSLLLDAFGLTRDAEKAYRGCAAAYVEAELYKDASLTMLTLVASLLLREDKGKATAACEDALEMMQDAGRACPAQMIELWEKLLALAREERLTERHLREARRLVEVHWNVPPRRASLPAPAADSQALQRRPQIVSAPRHPEPERPSQADLDAGVPLGGSYIEAMERCDRQLVGAALVHCGGTMAEAAGLLGISLNTLKAKVKKYGFDAAVAVPPSRSEGQSRQDQKADRQALSLLKARSAWAELSQLPPRRQIAKIRSTESLRTREMFTTVLSAASAGSLEDPIHGEELALVAQAIVQMLPESRCPEALRHDLLGEVFLIIGNCRRLTGEWECSDAAFDLARGHFAAGSGEPVLEARLFSLRASLASETGDLQGAQALLTRAERIYHRAQTLVALASTRITAAGVLLAGGQHAEALGRAQAVLRSLPPAEARLELLTRGLITECLVRLGRPGAALRSLATTWPLFESLPGGRNKLKAAYLNALVLEALGQTREAEAAWRSCIAGYAEAGLYKDALLTMLSRFRALILRGAREEAARACREALALEERWGHARTADLWRDLLARVGRKPLTQGEMQEAQQLVVRHWRVAAPPGVGASDVLRLDLNGPSAPMVISPTQVPATPEEPLPTFELPPAEQLANGGYRKTLERFEKTLLTAGLARAGGRYRPAARLLGMQRNALRAKARRYGIAS